MAEQVITATEDAFEEEEFSIASQWQLMWWRFRKHKPAIVSAIILGIFYLFFHTSPIIDSVVTR